MRRIKYVVISLLALLLLACQDKPLNNPHKQGLAAKKVFFSSFSEQPKTLDPARSYSVNEAIFTGQIYEPPLQYHYLKEPYELVPLTAASMPTPKFYDANKQLLPDNADESKIAYSVYRITIKPNIYYQPHPAFAKDEKGKYWYHQLTPKQVNRYNKLADFRHTATRELTAADYVYQIKRLAHPSVQSPIFGLLGHYILGLHDYAKQLQAAQTKTNKQTFFDLRDYPFVGAKALDRYTYQITLKGHYPQFVYWLAMPFFAPIPWEADKFYSQPGMRKNNITFDWYPIGTGAYMLTENNPNKQMIMQRNPNFHAEFYPTSGSDKDKKHGLLKSAGKRLPFIDSYVFSLEKESIPRWNKFLQGYYDQSGIGSDQFDQAINLDVQGQAELSQAMQAKQIHLNTSVTAGVFFLGFNMLDPVIGGNSERARKLRQAISIAINYEEFIAIFLNGRGIIAQSPIPPDIFGYRTGRAGMNPYVYDWINGKIVKKPLSTAKKLLRQAGFPNG
ncbi:MAG: ABC transporter substrate-binding protein, partial [Pseudomonadota bacterium]